MKRRDFIKRALTLAALMPLAKLDAGSTLVPKSAGDISADLLLPMWNFMTVLEKLPLWPMSL